MNLLDRAGYETTMLLAQGVQFDDSGLTDSARNVGDSIGNFLGPVIAIVGLIAAGVLLFRCIDAFRKSDPAEGVKHAIFAVIAVVISIVSFTGLGDIASTLNPFQDGGNENQFLNG